MPAPFSTRIPIAGLLALTAATGTIDAASYLALDRVFTGNMTGNVLFIGFALIGVDGIPLANNLIALAGFIAGSILGGRIVGRGHTPPVLPRRSEIALTVQAALLLMLGVVWLVAGEITGAAQMLVTAFLAVAMGVQVSAVKPVGNSDVTTIVVTNTIANLARDSPLAGGPGERWIPRLLAVLAMLAGAVIGAAAVTYVGGGLAILIASAFAGIALILLRRGVARTR